MASGEPTAWGSAAAIDIYTGRAAVLGSAPRTTYLALLTGAADSSMTVATMPEVNTAGYVRQPVTWTAPAIPTGGALYQSSNSNLISFGPFTASMLADAVYAALVSSSSGTGGDMIFFWAFDAPQTAVVNETIQIPAGKLILAHN